MAWRMEPSPKCSSLTTAPPFFQDAHQRREAPYEHEEYHQDHHLHHRETCRFSHGNDQWVIGILTDWKGLLNLGIWRTYYTFLFGHVAMFCLNVFFITVKSYPGSCCFWYISWRCGIVHTANTMHMHRFTRLETVLLPWHCIKITRNHLVFDSIGFWILPHTLNGSSWHQKGTQICFLHKQYQ